MQRTQQMISSYNTIKQICLEVERLLEVGFLFLGEVWLAIMLAWIRNLALWTQPQNYNHCRFRTLLNRHIHISLVLQACAHTHTLLSFLQRNGPALLSSATAKILIVEFENLKWFRSPWMGNVMYCAGCIMSHPSPVSKQQKKWQNQYKRVWRWF